MTDLTDSERIAQLTEIGNRQRGQILGLQREIEELKSRRRQSIKHDPYIERETR